MALTLDQILAPVSEDNPCGDDLSYDPERQEIEQAFEAKGGPGEEDAELDWRTVVRQIESQFGRTKDIWLAAYLCRAGARLGSLETVALGAEALGGLFQAYWDTVHPRLDELGLIGRKSPCDSLASRGDFLMPLEQVVLVRHQRLGAFTGQDLDRFRQEQESADGYGMFRAALADLGDGALMEASGLVDRIEAGLRQADQIFTAAAAGEPSPNFSPTYAALASLRAGLAAFMDRGEAGGAEAAPAEAGGEAGDGGGAAPAAAAQRLSGKIQSTEDVVRALDAIADYYRRNEPSHPILLLVARAKHWVGMDFLALMAEIAPDAVYTASQLLNKRE
jgi:type VI secretion system protein ImpA